MVRDRHCLASTLKKIPTSSYSISLSHSFSFVTTIFLFKKKVHQYQVFNSKLVTYGICRDQINHP